MSQAQQARKRARSLLQPGCEQLECRALLSGATARARALALARVTGPVGIFMGATSPYVLQQSSSAEITLTRPPFEAQNALSVQFSTGSSATPYSLAGKDIPVATPGQEYVPVNQTVTFQPGQTAITVSVPIVAGASNPGIVEVPITTTPLQSDAPTEHGEFAIVTGPDQLPLAIECARIVRQASGAAAIALTFNEPLAPATAEVLQNFRITPAMGVVHVPALSIKPASRHGKPPSASEAPALGAPIAVASLAADAFLAAVGASYKNPKPAPAIPLQSSTYDAATNTVTLITAKPLSLSHVYQVAIGPGVGTIGRHRNRSASVNLTSQSGNSLTWMAATPLQYQPAGANLTDLTAVPFNGFTGSPVSFYVASHSSSPPQLRQYSPPSGGSARYTFEL